MDLESNKLITTLGMEIGLGPWIKLCFLKGKKVPEASSLTNLQCFCLQPDVLGETAYILPFLWLESSSLVHWTNFGLGPLHSHGTLTGFLMCNLRIIIHAPPTTQGYRKGKQDENNGTALWKLWRMNCILGVKIATGGTTTWMIAKGARTVYLGRPGPLPWRSLRDIYTQRAVTMGKQSYFISSWLGSQMPRQVFW